MLLSSQTCCVMITVVQCLWVRTHCQFIISPADQDACINQITKTVQRMFSTISQFSPLTSLRWMLMCSISQGTSFHSLLVLHYTGYTGEVKLADRCVNFALSLSAKTTSKTTRSSMSIDVGSNIHFAVGRLSVHVSIAVVGACPVRKRRCYVWVNAVSR